MLLLARTLIGAPQILEIGSLLCGRSICVAFSVASCKYHWVSGTIRLVQAQEFLIYLFLDIETFEDKEVIMD